MKKCATCGKSTYKPNRRIYTKYCNLECRNNDPKYWKAISSTKSKQVVSEKQKAKISESLKRYYKDNPRPKKDNETFDSYKARCAFKFNVYDYPDKFDLHLVESHGWYKPSNKGNNLSGVSRDHMISVKYGFENNVDPEIISHPANCRLMIHSKNSSKCANCSITLDELLERIEKW